MNGVPRVLAFEAGGAARTGVAVAVSRAGGLGVVDLDGVGDADLTALLVNLEKRLSRPRRPYGVRIGASRVDPSRVSAGRHALRVVVVHGTEASDWARCRCVILEAGLVGMAEVAAREAAAVALDAGFDRLIVRGVEAGGLVGPDSAFVLMQAVLGRSPEGVGVWVRGGIGLQAASACVAAGAAGVVLEGALALTRESSVPPAVRARIANWDGTEPVLFGKSRDRRFRAYAPPGTGEARARVDATNFDRDGIADDLSPLVGFEPGRVWPIGQDVAFASDLARRFVTAGGVVQAVERAIDEGLAAAAERHRQFSEDGTAKPRAGVHGHAERIPKKKRPRPCDVAIVGMAAVAPGAADARKFWDNTLRGVDSIEEVPPDRWNWRLYFDADPKAPDRIISKWGGFVPDIPFDPLSYGMPPTSLPSIEPLHLLTLEVVRAALDDAGYRDRPFPRERTAVVLGAGGGAAQLAMGYAFRSYLPMLDTVIPGAGAEALAACNGLLPEWTEDSFPGILLNVAAGRVANRFDLGGANYTVDAACGSSLAAAAAAVRELESRAADVVLLGGADTVQNPFTYLAFSKTQAFSPRGRCRPFDAKADGIVISEAVAVLVLKRLRDAERDGDRIYAVIKGIGSSSDGRAKGLTAPRVEGQTRALRRAYESAGVSPATVGYVEAHGTGTAAGDAAEVRALSEVFSEAGADRRGCGLGSVKSLVGHTKCAAGLLGLMNATLALHHRVYPPTIGVEDFDPRAGLDSGPFHVSTATRPWTRMRPDQPRRAGVSAFGFGGTNFHAVLEAYEGDSVPAGSALHERPAELIVLWAEDRRALSEEAARLERALAFHPPSLRQVASAVHAASSPAPGGPVLAVVASSVDDLRAKLQAATRSIGAVGRWSDPTGIEYAERVERPGPRVAFLFPGQGSQSVGMLGEVAVAFPEVLDGFEAFDDALLQRGFRAVGPRVFPPPAWDEDEARSQGEALAATDVAQPALGASGVAFLRLLATLGVEADAYAGHSFGELVALHAAGVYSLEDLAELSVSRGNILLRAAGETRGAMAALGVGRERAEALIAGCPGVVVANLNGPRQTVVSGPRARIEAVLKSAAETGVTARLLSAPCAFHSPAVAGASAPLAELAARLGPAAPKRPVVSNVNATAYPDDPSEIARLVGEHAASRVDFAATVESLYERGIRVFLEVGPGGVLTPLVRSILEGKPHAAVALESGAKAGISDVLKALARLAVEGVGIDLAALTAGRCDDSVTWSAGQFAGHSPTLPPSTWLVNGSRARPANAPEPRRLGTGAALPGRAVARPCVELPPLPNGLSALPVSATDRDEVFEAFQRSMRSFLEVQKVTTLGYLSSRGGRTTAVEPTAASETAEPVLPNEANSEGCRDVERRLLEIVRDRTGYPSEMLGLDQDLEADLGIDSIKRVEVLGSLRDAFPVDLNGSESDWMDQLSRAKTLGAIVERFGRLLDTHQSGQHDSEAVQVPRKVSPTANVDGLIRRRMLRTVSAPLSPSGNPGIASGGVVVVTDDPRGVGRILADSFRSQGLHSLIVRHAGTATPRFGGDTTELDLGDSAQVALLRDFAASLGPIAGVVQTLPLGGDSGAGLDIEEWTRRLHSETRGLFMLARTLGPDLLRAAERGGAALIAATELGGDFSSLGGSAGDSFAGQGAVSGLLKTLAKEWPTVRVRAVDFKPGESVAFIAGALADETLNDDERVEVGYPKRSRTALVTEARGYAARDEFGGVRLDPGDSVVITGGARGITAEVAVEFARRWKPILLLVGSGPIADEDDFADIPTEGGDAAVKAALLDRMRRRDRHVRPAELEAAYRGLRRDREIRANVRRIKAAGATVEYGSADVRDRSSLARVLDGWRRSYGPPVGLIHGAGVIHDKLLLDKSPNSFDRVFGTKVLGAVNVAGLVDPYADSLKFAAFFSSVAGRFGNRGQSDYSAANEALNKLAICLDRRWRARVVSVMWGPWSDVGMVSDLGSHLGRQGFGLITPEAGRSFLADELQFGRKGDVEVVAAGAIGTLDDDADGRPR